MPPLPLGELGPHDRPPPAPRCLAFASCFYARAFVAPGRITAATKGPAAAAPTAAAAPAAGPVAGPTAGPAAGSAPASSGPQVTARKQ